MTHILLLNFENILVKNSICQCVGNGGGATLVNYLF